MKWLLVLFLASHVPCPEEYQECKEENCAGLEGIEWSKCVDKCMDKYRKCERRRDGN
jgi:hypothetical protein